MVRMILSNVNYSLWQPVQIFPKDWTMCPPIQTHWYWVSIKFRSKASYFKKVLFVMENLQHYLKRADSENYFHTKFNHICKSFVYFQKPKHLATYYTIFLVSGRGLACQQEISLALSKTPPIHYGTEVDSAFSNSPVSRYERPRAVALASFACVDKTTKIITEFTR